MVEAPAAPSGSTFSATRRFRESCLPLQPHAPAPRRFPPSRRLGVRLQTHGETPPCPLGHATVHAAAAGPAGRATAAGRESHTRRCRLHTEPVGWCRPPQSRYILRQTPRMRRRSPKCLLSDSGHLRCSRPDNRRHPRRSPRPASDIWFYNVSVKARFVTRIPGVRRFSVRRTASGKLPGGQALLRKNLRDPLRSV
jgi:hypothetical protein